MFPLGNVPFLRGGAQTARFGTKSRVGNAPASRTGWGVLSPFERGESAAVVHPRTRLEFGIRETILSPPPFQTGGLLIPRKWSYHVMRDTRLWLSAP